MNFAAILPEMILTIGATVLMMVAALPPVIAAMMLMQGHWKGVGVFNVEELNPEPFLDTLSKNGLPFKVVDHAPLPEKI